MERQLAAGAVRPAGADRLRHVGDADDAVVAVGIGVLGRDLAPVLAAVAQFDLAAEIVGVGHDQRARLAVELDRTVPVPGRRRSSSSIVTAAPLDEHQRAGDMGRDLDRDARALQRLAGDDALGRASGSRRR